MPFVGKLAYMTLFPGLLFITMAGMLARSVHAGISGAVTGSNPRGPAGSLPSSFDMLFKECIPAGGALQAAQWIAPAVRLSALSWASCIVFGFLEGDVVLVYALLLLAAASDLLLCSLSANPRDRQNALPRAVSLLGWAVPFAFVISGVALRTGQMSLGGIIEFQGSGGALLGSVAGGGLALAGSWMGFLAALLCGLALTGLRPFGGGRFADVPFGTGSDISGAPLALMSISEAASFFVVPFLIVALFLGGHASRWHEVVFWALKVAGVFILMAVADTVSPRVGSDRVLLLLMGAAGVVALTGLLLIRFGG